MFLRYHLSCVKLRQVQIELIGKWECFSMMMRERRRSVDLVPSWWYVAGSQSGESVEALIGVVMHGCRPFVRASAP